MSFPFTSSSKLAELALNKFELMVFNSRPQLQQIFKKKIIMIELTDMSITVFYRINVCYYTMSLPPITDYNACAIINCNVCD